MTSALKNYLNSKKCYIEKEEFDNLICPEIIENGLLDELLDLLYEYKTGLSIAVVEKQLSDYYSSRLAGMSVAEKEACKAKVQYLINKQQISVFKTLMAN